MILSTYKAGQIVEQGLKTVGMLAMSRFGLTVENVLDKLHQSVIDVVNAHFPDDKRNYHETRLTGGITNGKRGDLSVAYNAATRELGAVVTPPATANDVGKLITFFDFTPAIPTFHYGIIQNYISAGPKYVIQTFYDIPDLVDVRHVTVGHVLITGDVLVLGQGNELFSAEDLVVYDASNQQTIDIVDDDTFHRRLKMSTWKNGDMRWGRYKSRTIEFANGTQAPEVGTLFVSGYWVPPRPTSLADGVYVSDTRIPEVVKLFTQSLYADKVRQPVQTPQPAALEERHRTK